MKLLKPSKIEQRYLDIDCWSFLYRLISKIYTGGRPKDMHRVAEVTKITNCIIDFEGSTVPTFGQKVDLSFGDTQYFGVMPVARVNELDFPMGDPNSWECTVDRIMATSGN